MKFTIEIPDKEIYKIGEETIKNKLREYLEFLFIEKDLKVISKEIKKHFSEKNYWQEIEKIKKEAWEEYKKDLKLQWKLL